MNNFNLLDDFDVYFAFILNEQFLYDICECIYLNFYYRLNEHNIRLILVKQKTWDAAIKMLFKLSHYKITQEIENIIYNHLGSIVAEYCVKTQNVLTQTFKTKLDISFITKFFHINRGDIAYYHNGNYICQITERQ